MNEGVSMAVDNKKAILRHTVATLAYRGGKAVLKCACRFRNVSR